MTFGGLFSGIGGFTLAFDSGGLVSEPAVLSRSARALGFTSVPVAGTEPGPIVVAR